MVFGLFKRKDPICGMKEEKGKGISDKNNWFCSEQCKKDFYKKKPKESCCCH